MWKYIVTRTDVPLILRDGKGRVYTVKRMKSGISYNADDAVITSHGIGTRIYTEEIG